MFGGELAGFGVEEECGSRERGAGTVCGFEGNVGGWIVAGGGGTV